MDLGLKDKVVLVTIRSGIGQQIAMDMAAEGAIVVGADLNGDAAKQTASDAGDLSEGVALDVFSFEQVKGVVDQVVASHGRIDVLVNCAAAWRVGMFMDSTPDDWAEVNVCLMGVIHCTRATLEKMIPVGRQDCQRSL